MPIVRSEDIEPRTLDEAGRAALIDALYAVQRTIFANVSREEFGQHVVYSSADHTVIRVHYDEKGAIVGFFGAHAFVRTLQGRPALILRGEAGNLRGARGGGSSLGWALRRAFDYRRRFPGLPMWFMGCMVHPSSYLLLVRSLGRVWPSPKHPVEGPLQDELAALADSFGLDRVGGNPLVRDGHWATRDTPAEREAWARSTRPEVVYYRAQNPTYADGHGLLTLVRLDATTLGAGVGRFVSRQVAATTARLKATLLRLPGVGPRLTARVVRQQLGQSPLFAGLSAAQLDALAARSTRVGVPASTRLWSQGDPGQDLYLLLSGAIAILAPGEAGEEQILDQLDPGEVFGEIAAISGEPRSAGARTISPSQLLRIDRGALLAAMAADPALQAALYARYTARRQHHDRDGYPPFSGLTAEAAQRLREGPLLRRLPEDAFAALLREAQPQFRPPGAQLFAEGDPADAFYLLRAGSVEVRIGEQRVARLLAGSTFGERGLNGDGEGRRTATVVALSPCELLRVDPATFAARVAPSLPERWSEARIVDDAGVAQVFGEGRSIQPGTIEGQPCVRATERLPDGRRLEVVARPAPPLLRLTVDPPGEGKPWEIVHDTQRIELRGERILRVTVTGDLSVAAPMIERLRSGAPARPAELERFRWTGRLGPPVHEADRLLCGCTGLRRGALLNAQAQGCTSVDALCENTGAGTVCGACRPLLRRVWQGERSPAPGADEVSPEAFEAALEEARSLDGVACIAAPGSATWRVTGEQVALLGGLRALLIQFAYGDAMGLVDHSAFLSQPAARLYATLDTMFGLGFADGATMLRLAREVFEKHQRVEGTFARDTGRFKAGQRYAATHIEALVWVACTVVESAVFTQETLISPLSAADKDALVAEAADFYRLFGIPRDRFPSTWAALQAHVHDTLASDKAVVGPHAQALATALLRPPTALARPLYAILRLLTGRWLPPDLARAYGLALSPAEARAADRLTALIAAANRALPQRYRTAPARLHAERRLRGEPGPDPLGLRVDGLLRRVLGVESAGRLHKS